MKCAVAPVVSFFMPWRGAAPPFMPISQEIGEFCRSAHQLIVAPGLRASRLPRRGGGDRPGSGRRPAVRTLPIGNARGKGQVNRGLTGGGNGAGAKHHQLLRMAFIGC